MLWQEENYFLYFTDILQLLWLKNSWTTAICHIHFTRESVTIIYSVWFYCIHASFYHISYFKSAKSD